MCEARNTINYAKVGEEKQRERAREKEIKNIIIITTKPAKPNEAKRQAQKQLPVTWKANA